MDKSVTLHGICLARENLGWFQSFHVFVELNLQSVLIDMALAMDRIHHRMLGLVL